ncbi:MAG: hypothetical protein LBB35_04320, partial [Coriobacteriaceae bacterium]|nr:hypothetical protein [Coriobacteriaceae bacterium]
MKIKTACTCRGDGKAYIEIFVTKFSPLSRLFLTGTTFAGNKVPTQLHVLDETDKTKHAVLVFPIATCPLTLSIQEMPVDGRECPSVPITVRPHVLKWMSRFNYRFKSETCALIRDIDQDDFFSHATIKLDTCIPSKTTNILRGLLFLPWAEEKPYSLKLLNGALEEIPCEIITMTDIKIPQKPTTPVDLQRIVFSCRIPQEIAPYTLYFENPTGDLRSNFAVLEAAVYAQRLDDFRQVTLNADQDPAYPQ